MLTKVSDSGSVEYTYTSVSLMPDGSFYYVSHLDFYEEGPHTNYLAGCSNNYNILSGHHVLFS